MSSPDELVETSPGERLITHLRHVDLAVPDFDRQLGSCWIGLSPSASGWTTVSPSRRSSRTTTE